MKKVTWFLGALAFGIALVSCNKQSGAYKKLKDGAEYKIIGSGNGKAAAYGDILKFHYAKKYKDSILSDTYSQPPVYQPIDSMQLPKEFYNMFKQARPGDSIVIRILTDSAYKTGIGMMPKEFKKGEYLFTVFKILDVLKPDKAQEDFGKERAKFIEQDSLHKIGQKIKDDKTLQDYFAKNNLHPTKTPLGAYIDIKEAGGTPGIDGQVISVMYRGKLLDGTVFDSNLDSTSRSHEPYIFPFGQHRSIPGFEDGLKMIGKGGKATIYIPSVLGYGSQGSGKIKPDQNLIFEVEVADLKDAPKPQEPRVAPAPDTAKKLPIRPLKPLPPVKKKN
ncbi:MAG: FKBP-type peptidyl-prolyl cis-trans isomerase [Agriterribacter sp.]